jgi:hypothetical protein
MIDVRIFGNEPLDFGEPLEQQKARAEAKSLGVLYLEEERVLVFSYAFILRFGYYPPGTDTEYVISHLKDLDSLSAAEFCSRYSPIYNPPPKRESKYAPRWTFAADVAIKTLYRPNMTAEDKEKLAEACKDRTVEDLRRRARILRRQMIRDGVFDVRDLPHRNYNKNIQKEIDTEKRRRRKAKS